MSRYIDKDKLLDDLNWHAPDGYNAKVNEVITKQPEADVVEVVRCKDCKYSREMNEYEKKIYPENCIGCVELYMSFHTVIMDKNSYCSHGERKDRYK